MLTNGQRATYFAIFILVLIFSSIILYLLLFIDRGNKTNAGCTKTTDCSGGHYCSGANSCIKGSGRTENEVCFLNSDCNHGLSCVSNKCVNNNKDKSSSSNTGDISSSLSIVNKCGTVNRQIDDISGKQVRIKSFSDKLLTTKFNGRTMYLSVGTRESSLITTPTQRFDYDGKSQKLIFRNITNSDNSSNSSLSSLNSNLSIYDSNYNSSTSIINSSFDSNTDTATTNSDLDTNLNSEFKVTINGDTGEMYTGLKSSTIMMVTISNNPEIPDDMIFMVDMCGNILEVIDPTTQNDTCSSSNLLLEEGVDIIFVGAKYNNTTLNTAPLGLTLRD